MTRRARLDAFFWVQSLIRDDGQRRLLFELDTSIRRLTESGADAAALLQAYRRLSQPAAPVGRNLIEKTVFMRPYMMGHGANVQPTVPTSRRGADNYRPPDATRLNNVRTWSTLDLLC